MSDSNVDTLARLAFEIMRSENRPVLSRLAVGDPRTMGELRTAILAAEEILRAVRDRRTESIHAYRAFASARKEGSSRQSIKEIHARFQEINWPKGLEEGSVRSRIWEILEQTEREVDRLREGMRVYYERCGIVKPDDLEIQRSVGDLLQRVAIPGLIGNPERLQSRIAGVIGKMIDQATVPMFRSIGVASEIHFFTISSFMKFLCGYDTVAEAKRAGELRVRPYELFLTAKQQEIQTDRLTRRLNELSRDFIPEPENTDSLPIMFIHTLYEENDDVRCDMETNRLLAEAEAESRAAASGETAAAKVKGTKAARKISGGDHSGNTPTKKGSTA